MTMFALVDCNNFYASCERLFRPDLYHQPIVVLSNNDGCVIARSNETKALGIGMGEPFFKIKALCTQHRIHVFSSNHTLYNDLSARVMAVIQAEWEETEIYSIDEAFLDLHSMPDHLIEAFCWDLQKKILQITGIPTSIGIGPTKTLAKAANFIAKKKLKTPVFSIVNQAFWLKELAVGEIWGIGRHGQQKLVDLGIHTAFELIHWDAHALKTHFNVCLQRTVAELQGQSCVDLVVLEQSKSILSSRSFGTVQTTYSALREAVSYHCGIAWEKLRHQHLKVKRLSVFVYTGPYRETNTVSMTLPMNTDDIRIITRYAEFCLKKLYQAGSCYKKCGVLLTDLEDKQVLQYDLFTETSEASLIQTEKTMKVIEAINHKYQSKTVYLAAEGVTKKWSMKRNRMTPCYTTKWTDLALVYAK